MGRSQRIEHFGFALPPPPGFALPTIVESLSASRSARHNVGQKDGRRQAEEEKEVREL